MKTNHTPGPWFIFNDEPQRVYAKYGEYGNLRCVSDSRHDEEAEANARLIAAAPELLEALLAQKEASEARSMASQYQDESERAITFNQKQEARKEYLRAAQEADQLWDKAVELRYAALAKAAGHERPGFLTINGAALLVSFLTAFSAVLALGVR